MFESANELFSRVYATTFGDGTGALDDDEVEWVDPDEKQWDSRWGDDPLPVVVRDANKVSNRGSNATRDAANLIAVTENRLKMAIGKRVPVVFDIQEVYKNSPYPDTVIEVFEENDGEFCLERIVEAVIDVCVIPGGRRALENRLKGVQIINVNEPGFGEAKPNMRPTLNKEGVLEIRACFEIGEEGCPTRGKIKSELMVLLELYEVPGKPRDLGKQVATDILPLWEEKIEGAVGERIPFEVAWDSFRGNTYLPALRTLLREDGEHVFRPIYAAIVSILDSGIATPEEFAQQIGKIRIKNLAEEEEGDMFVAVQPFKDLPRGKDQLKPPEEMMKGTTGIPLRSEIVSDQGKKRQSKLHREALETDSGDDGSERHGRGGHAHKRGGHGAHKRGRRGSESGSGTGSRDGSEGSYEAPSPHGKKLSVITKGGSKRMGSSAQGKHAKRRSEADSGSGSGSGGSRGSGSGSGSRRRGASSASASASATASRSHGKKKRVHVMRTSFASRSARSRSASSPGSRGSSRPGRSASSSSRRGSRSRSSSGASYEDDGGKAKGSSKSAHHDHGKGSDKGHATKMKAGHQSDDGSDHHGHGHSHKGSQGSKHGHGKHGHDHGHGKHGHDHGHGKHGHDHGHSKHGHKDDSDDHSHGARGKGHKGAKKGAGKAKPPPVTLGHHSRFMLVVKGAYDMEAEGCHRASEIKLALVNHFQGLQEELSDEAELKNHLIPDTESELTGIMGRGITIEVLWDSLRDSGAYEECCTTLVVNNGENLLARVVDVFREFAGVEAFVDSELDRVVVERRGSKDVHVSYNPEEKSLHVVGAYEAGARGCPTREMLRNELVSHFIIAEVDSVAVPLLSDEIYAATKDKNIKVKVDWDSFLKKAEDPAAALTTLYEDNGRHVFQPITAAFKRMAKDKALREAATHRDTGIKTVLIKHTPGRSAGKKVVKLSGRTLTVAGVHELPKGKGCASEAEIASAIMGSGSSGGGGKAALEELFRKAEEDIADLAHCRVTLAANYDSFAKNLDAAVETILTDDSKYVVERIVAAFKAGYARVPSSFKVAGAGLSSPGAGKSSHRSGDSEKRGGGGGAEAGGGGALALCGTGTVMLAEGPLPGLVFEPQPPTATNPQNRGRIVIVGKFSAGPKEGALSKDELAVITDMGALAPLMPLTDARLGLVKMGSSGATRQADDQAREQVDFLVGSHGVLATFAHESAKMKPENYVAHLRAMLAFPCFWQASTQLQTKILKAAADLVPKGEVHVKSWLVYRVGCTNNVDKEKLVILTSKQLLVFGLVANLVEIKRRPDSAVPLTKVKHIQVGHLAKVGVWTTDKPGDFSRAVRIHGPDSKGPDAKPSENLTFRGLMTLNELADPRSCSRNAIIAGEIAWATYMATKGVGSACDAPKDAGVLKSGGSGFGKLTSAKGPNRHNYNSVTMDTKK